MQLLRSIAQSISKSFASVAKFSLRRRFICLVLILSLLILPLPSQAYSAIPSLVSPVTNILSGPLQFLPSILSWLRGSSQTRERQTVQSRTGRVSSIRLTPDRLVAYLSESYDFAARGLDSSGKTVHGAKFSWTSENSEKIRIDETGRATFLQSGETKIYCQAGSATAQVTVLVRPIRRPLQTDEEWKTDQNTAQAGSGGTIGLTNLLPTLMDKLMPTSEAQGTVGGDIPQAANINFVGHPYNTLIESSRLGAIIPRTNYNAGFPVVSLGGRGLAASLVLVYNSNVWGGRTISGTGPVFTFDPIQGWPSPGFTLGFPRIAWYNQQYDAGLGDNTCDLMLIDPDGTMHNLGTAPVSSSVTLETSDGTHITYVGTARNTGGTLYYNDGTRITISHVNNRMLATRVTDTNGNYIQIAYKDAASGFAPMAIDTLTDTLGRVTQFNYGEYPASATSLTSITPPAGSATSFSYSTVTMNTDFPNATENVGSTFSAVTGLTVPNRPPYTFTYSGYGMIYDIDWSSSGTSGSVTFDYPTGGETLSQGPTFSQRVETGTNCPTGTFTYAYSSGVETITRPDGSKMKITPNSQIEITNSSNTVFAKTVHTYANDPGGDPQIATITYYDDTNTPTKVDFDYDIYGNLVNKRDYGHQLSGTWKVRRRTKNTYLTSSTYTNNYIRARLFEVEVYDAKEDTNDANDELVGKTQYLYDSTTVTTYSGANPPGYSSGYAYTYPGRQTGQKVYSNAVSGTYIQTTKNSDQFGNVVKAEVSCCNEKSATFSEETYWSQPDEVIKGSTGSVHLTSTMTYDFDSGHVEEVTNPIGLVTSYGYSVSGLPSGKTLPTGATTSATYNAWGLPVSSSGSYDDGGTTRTLSMSVVYNGFGQPIEEVNIHGGQINTTYDAMGRAASVTNPFTAGGTPSTYVTEYDYDTLGRVTVVTLPDGDTVQTAYSGLTVTATDQVNRKIKREMDSLGRLIKVYEQDVSNGNLTQETTYTYNLMDKLTKVDQGGQLREFKYDDLGRLIYEKIPEQTVSIKEQPSDPAPQWTAKYTYTDFHAVATRKDARGVITTYTYDSLHRMTEIEYDTSGASGVESTANVEYTYDDDDESPTFGLLLSVSNGSATEEYNYDSNKRLSSIERTIGSQSYTTSYEYNEANQMTKLTYPSSYYFYIDRDTKGRLLRLTPTAGSDTGSYVKSVGYNIAGQRTGQTLGNGVVESYGYDTERLQMTTQTAVKNTTTLLSLTYDYDAASGESGYGSTAGNSGQLMGISGTTGAAGLGGGGGVGSGGTESAAYTYDNLERLVTSNQTTNSVSAQRRFAYDRWGNRTGVWNATSGGTQIQSISIATTSSVANNRVSSVTTNGGSPVSYSYDANGNVTNDGTHTYVYDAENRVVSVDSGPAATYAYDYQNRRVKKVVGSTTTHYVWQGGLVIAEHNGSNGALLVNYTFAGGRMIMKTESSTTSYYLSDRLSARLVLNTSGSIVGRQAHLPFGEELNATGTNDKHRMTSYERDSETGNDYAVNRGYAPSLGRFNQVDPMAGSPNTPQSLNRFAYVQGDPINATDPQGLQLSSEFCRYFTSITPVLFYDEWFAVVTVHRICGSTGAGGEQGGAQDCTAASLNSRLDNLDKHLFNRDESGILKAFNSIAAATSTVGFTAGGELNAEAKEYQRRLLDISTSIFGALLPIDDPRHPYPRDIIEESDALLTQITDWLKRVRAKNTRTTRQALSGLYEDTKKATDLVGSINFDIGILAGCQLDREQNERLKRISERWKAFERVAVPLLTSFKAPDSTLTGD